MAQMSGTTQRTEPASTMGNAPLSVAAFVTHQVTMWFEQGPGATDWQQFWANTSEWSALRPGAYALLSHNAGNGFLERVFSASSDWLQRKCLVVATLYQKLMLKFNAHVLAMPGYSSSPAFPPTQPQPPAASHGTDAPEIESSDDDSAP